MRKALNRFLWPGLVVALTCVLAGCPAEVETIPVPVTVQITATPTYGSAPLTVSFAGGVDVPPAQIDTWEWSFGDGATSPFQNPVHTYDSTGLYTVTLSVSGPAGTGSLTKENFIIVTDAPGNTITAGFSATPVTGDEPLTVQFTDLSTASATITSWSWDFGDGGTSTEQSPSYIYNTHGTYTVGLTVSDGTLSDTETKTAYINVTQPATGPAPLVSGSLKVVGVPSGGLPVISDLQVFNNVLWMMEAKNPLADWGAKVYTYDGSNFTLKLSDSTSQGYLRGRVIGSKLYVPDGDPNGYDPGIVYIWSSASGSYTATSVTSSVHNFDVVQYNGKIYTSGGLSSGSSGLNEFDGSTTWPVKSTGSFSRLKYLAAFDGKIWASKRNIGASADLVWIDTSMQQQGVEVLTGTEAMATDMTVINSKLYITMWGTTGVAHMYVVPTTYNVTYLKGISSDLIWEYCLHSDGNIYGVAMYGIYGSQDGVNFTKIISVSDNRFGQPGGNNADGRASIASYNGKLYVGSSTNGTLYKIE
jgi:PKD repeat protein